MNVWHSFWRGAGRPALALVLACMMLLATLPLAEAAPDPRAFRAVTVGQPAQAGTSVSVSVYLEPGNTMLENDAYHWYLVKILYDYQALTLKENDGVVDELHASVFDVNSLVSGVIFVEASGFEGMFVEDARSVMTLNFEVSADMWTDELPVVIDIAAFKLDTDMVMIEDKVNGSIQVTNDPPTAANVSVTGEARVGGQLTGSYTYHDTEGNVEGNSEHRWYVAEQADGSDKVLIEGAHTNQLTLTAEMEDHYITYGVKPVATKGTTQGAEKESAVFGPIAAGQVLPPGMGTIVIGEGEGQGGQTVRVPVALRAASEGVGAFGLQIDYDPDVLEVTGVSQQLGDLFGSHYDNEAGWLRVGWADTDADDPVVQADQTLFAIDFLIKSNAAAGEYALTVDTTQLSRFSLANTEAMEMDKALEPGKIVVKAAQTSGWYPPIQWEPIGRERLTLPVGDSPDGLELGQQLSSIVIERTLLPDGSKQDKLAIGLTEAREIVAKLAASGSKWAYLHIPDAEDAVSRTLFTISPEAAQLLADADIGLGLTINDVKIKIPGASLADYDEDLYFHIIPVKDSAEQQSFVQRMNQSEPIQGITTGEQVEPLGRPVTIQTNMQQRAVQLTLPTHTSAQGAVASAYVQAFAEHSDTTTELLDGQWVSYTADGQMGFEFVVDHFSTFALVQLPTPTPYISGYEDGTFRPDAPVTRAETALMLARLGGLDLSKWAGQSIGTYTDVRTDHWAQSAIAAATDKNWFTGYPDGSFAPSRTITRAELAVVASALLVDTAGNGQTSVQPFTDLAAGHWAEAAIGRLQQAGIVLGYPDGSFAPDQAVTRAEAVTLFNRLSGRLPITADITRVWPDVLVDHWASADIAAATLAE